MGLQNSAKRLQKCIVTFLYFLCFYFKLFCIQVDLDKTQYNFAHILELITFPQAISTLYLFTHG